MSEKAFAAGDVLQIDPAHDERFGGCFLVVTEAKSWGVVGYVKVPAEGDAYYRCPNEALVFIGLAEWLHPEDAESAT